MPSARNWNLSAKVFDKHLGLAHTGDMTTYPVSITLAGTTETVEFHTLHGQTPGPDTRLFSDYVFAAQIGRGTKAHRTGMTAWPVADEKEARRHGHTHIFVVEGQTYGAHNSTAVRNRQARIIGFASTYEGTGAGAAHNAYNGIA